MSFGGMGEGGKTTAMTWFSNIPVETQSKIPSSPCASSPAVGLGPEDSVPLIADALAEGHFVAQSALVLVARGEEEVNCCPF